MRRRHDHRSGTWRWQPRQRPAAAETETTDVVNSATTAGHRGEYTTGRLTWRLGVLGFAPPRRPHTDNDTAQDGDAAA